MNPNALAEVYVGRFDEGHAKKYLGFATGYPIARDRVITAGHVLAEDYGFIEVRFRNSKENSNLIPAELSKDFRPELDVAVLRCAIPKDVAENPTLLVEYPSSVTQGQGMGYPRISDAHNTPGESRSVQSFQGDLGVLERTSMHFQFSTNFELKTQSEGWKGLSGAPVFHDDRFAGVVQEYLGYATTARFRVVAMCRLRELERFRVAIGWPERSEEEYRARTLARIRKLLEDLGRVCVSNALVLRDLEKALRSDDDDSELPSGADAIPIILDALVDRREFSIGVLSDFHKEFCAAGDGKAAEIISEIVDHVTPLVIDPELINRVWNQIKAEKTFLFSAPVNRAAAVEALMARVDEKSMKVKQPVALPAEDYDGMPSLRGRKAPIDAPGPEALAKAILLDLCASHDVPDSLGPSRALNELVRRFAGILIVKSGTRQIKGRTLYCFHVMPDDPQGLALHTEALRLIWTKLGETRRDTIKNLPELVFVVLSTTSETETLQSVIVTVLNTRFQLEKHRSSHAATSP